MSELRPIKDLQADFHAYLENGIKDVPMSFVVELVDHLRNTMIRIMNVEQRLHRFIDIDESFNPNAEDDGLLEIQEDYPIVETKK